MAQPTLLPLLHTQRELYRIPRGWERFRAYLQTITQGTDAIVVPLLHMNPMGKEHVAEKLDQILALGAEEIATAALAEAERRLARVEGRLEVGLVVVDDAQGGWTNRYLTEAGMRFPTPSRRESYALRKGWAIVPIWTSEDWDREGLRAAVLAETYRALHLKRHGPPRTLREMMRQEGLTVAFVGTRAPSLAPDELEYVRDIITPHLDSDRFPTAFACLYADEAALSVGYPPLGLPPRAGFAVALDDARHGGPTPEAALVGRPTRA